MNIYFDRLDVMEAWYLYLVHFHEGQGSDKYKRLSKLLKYYTPGAAVRYQSLTANGKKIYNKLKERYESQIQIRGNMSAKRIQNHYNF